MSDYDAAAARARRPPAATGRDDQELVRLATLAASSHNTQPWTFDVAPDAITIRPDLTRRCDVVDPDDAHLFKSLGCAAENMVHAAAAQGLEARPTFDARRQAVVVQLSASSAATPSPLAGAILTRQCTRGLYDGRPLAADDVAALQHAGDHEGVRCVLLTGEEQIEALVADVTRGDLIQFGDPGFRRELVSWVRFNPRAALRSGDGLAGRTTGQPAVPTWFGTALQRVVISATRQARQDEERLRSSAGVAAFVTAGDDPEARVSAGRAYQRFALQAEVLDIRTAFINQPIEVPELRPGFERWLGLVDQEHAQLLVRFGRGAKLPYSLRRPLDEVVAAP